MNPSWRPNAEQEYLLEACLESGDRAERALRAWIQSVDLDHIDGGSYRLLPLLALKAFPPGLDSNLQMRIKGVYRRTWYHNNLLIVTAGNAASFLGKAGIPVMLLKGAALVLEHYRDIGARPMGDVDLVVPVAFARRAAELMDAEGWMPEATPLKGAMTPGRTKGKGWSPGPRAIDCFDERYFHVRHAHGFQTPNGLGIDLHWHVFQEDCDPDSDMGTWRDASQFESRRFPIPILIPAPHEHLLLILAHAARWNPVPSIRWVADATTLIRTSPKLDWGQFVSVAIQRRQTSAALELLSYLSTRFSTTIPADILRTLAEHPSIRETRAAYRRNVSPPTALTGVTEILYLYRRYKILRRQSPQACPAGFPRFVCGILGAEHVSQVLDYSIREGVRRLRGIR